MPFATVLNGRCFERLSECDGDDPRTVDGNPAGGSCRLEPVTADEDGDG